MQPVLYGYLPVLVFLVIAGGIAVAMVGGSLLVARQKPYAEKLSAYECGFEPFDDAAAGSTCAITWSPSCSSSLTSKWRSCFPGRSPEGHRRFRLLVDDRVPGVLTVGFIYEWCKGALEWE